MSAEDSTTSTPSGEANLREEISAARKAEAAHHRATMDNDKLGRIGHRAWRGDDGSCQQPPKRNTHFGPKTQVRT